MFRVVTAVLDASMLNTALCILSCAGRLTYGMGCLSGTKSHTCGWTGPHRLSLTSYLGAWGWGHGALVVELHQHMQRNLAELVQASHTVPQAQPAMQAIDCILLCISILRTWRSGVDFVVSLCYTNCHSLHGTMSRCVPFSCGCLVLSGYQTQGVLQIKVVGLSALGISGGRRACDERSTRHAVHCLAVTDCIHHTIPSQGVQ
jgi:hypothetical protein